MSLKRHPCSRLKNKQTHFLFFFRFVVVAVVVVVFLLSLFFSFRLFVLFVTWVNSRGWAVNNAAALVMES